MNKEEIIAMAKKAGLFKVSLKIDDKHETLFDMCLFDFAKLVAAQTLMKIDPSSFMSYQEGFEAGQLAERERIKEQNAPEIEKTNAYIKQLELEKMESDILHNEHLKLLGEIKAMTEAARSAEREECAKVAENISSYDRDEPEKSIAKAIRARGK